MSLSSAPTSPSNARRGGTPTSNGVSGGRSHGAGGGGDPLSLSISITDSNDQTHLSIDPSRVQALSAASSLVHSPKKPTESSVSLLQPVGSDTSLGVPRNPSRQRRGSRRGSTRTTIVATDLDASGHQERRGSFRRRTSGAAEGDGSNASETTSGAGQSGRRGSVRRRSTTADGEGANATESTRSAGGGQRETVAEASPTTENVFSEMDGDGNDALTQRKEDDAAPTAAEEQAAEEAMREGDAPEDWATLPSSLFLFSGTNPFRVMCLIIMQHRYFSRLILSCIVVNSLCLALVQPAIRNPPELDTFLSVMDYTFSGVFIIEMCIKVVALGFVLHRGAYLRLGWNVLDFIIVVSSIFNIWLDVSAAKSGGGQSNAATGGIDPSGLKALRVVRVLRPLRSLTTVKPLQRLIQGLFAALPTVIDNLLLFGFILFLFSVAGIQLWSGRMTNRCYITQFPQNTTALLGAAGGSNVLNFTTAPSTGSNASLLVLPTTTSTAAAGGPGTFLVPSIYNRSSVRAPFLIRNDPDFCGGIHQCGSPLLDHGYALSANCESHRDLFYRRNMNFDNLFSSALLVFKVMTFDNWPDDLSDAMNFAGDTAALFFLLLTLLGGYGCVNLFLAVLTDGYTTGIRDAERFSVDVKIQVAETDAEFLLTADDLGDATMAASSPMAAAMGHTSGKANPSASSKGVAASHRLAGTSGTASPPALSPKASIRVITVGPGGAHTTSGMVPPLQHPPPHQAVDASISPRGSMRKAVAAEGGSGALSPKGSMRQGPSAQGASSDPVIGGGQFLSSSPSGSMRKPIHNDTANGQPGLASQVDATTAAAGGQKSPRNAASAADEPPTPRSKETPAKEPELVVVDPCDTTSEPGDGQEEFDEEGEEEEEEEGSTSDDNGAANGSPAGSFRVARKGDHRCLARRLVGQCLSTRLSEFFMLFVTVVNVVALAIDHYGIPKDLDATLDIVSLVCTAIFAVDILLKLFAWGLDTFRSAWNNFDIVLVILSIVTIALSGGQGSAFSAFRALRILRIFRLVSHIESLRVIIAGAITSVVSITYLFMLLLLFLYVYAILGMQLFGLEYAKGMDDVRDSFGTFWQSILLTFIVITGENWTSKMRVGMANQSNGLEVLPVLYFVTLFMIGNYIIINLSVAIIMNKMQDELRSVDDEKQELFPPILLLARYVPSKDKKADSPEGSMGASDFSASTSMAGATGRRGAGSGVFHRRPSFLQLVAARTKQEEEALDRELEAVVARNRSSDHDSLPADGDLAASNQHKTHKRLKQQRAAMRKVQALVAFQSPAVRRSDTVTIPEDRDDVTAVHDVNDVQPLQTQDVDEPGQNDPSQKRFHHGSSITRMTDDTEMVPLNPPTNTNNKPNDSVTAAAATAEVGGNGSGDGAAGNGAAEMAHVGRYLDDLEYHRDSCAYKMHRVGKFFYSWFVSEPPIVEEVSLKCFAIDNRVRVFCLWLLGLPLFNGFIYLTVIANALLLFFDSPDNTREFDDANFAADYAFAVIFVLELVIKIIALGLWWPAKKNLDDGAYLGEMPTAAYLRDGWNVLDAFVTVTSVIALVVPVLRVLRAFRSIRLVVRFDTLRIILVALLEAFPLALNALMLATLLFIVFGILGVQLMKGKTYYCNDASIRYKHDCVDFYNQSTVGAVFDNYAIVPREWKRADYHFDHLGGALLAVFIVAVSDGWSTIMFIGMDTVDEETAMTINASPWLAFYFVAVILSCTIFALNVMVGILVNYFNQKKKIHDGSALLTPEQRRYVSATAVINQTVSANEHEIPLHIAVSEWLHHVINWKPAWKRLTVSIFDLFMTVVILLNTVAVAIVYDGMPDETQSVLDIIQLVCLLIYSLEALIRMVTYGLGYFVPGWNRFDLAVVIVGWVSLVLPQLSWLSFLRVVRLVKLIRGTGVERLIATVVRSLDELINVVLVLVLNYFIFAVAGVELFGQVKWNGAISATNNFRSVWRAMLALYRCGTTEGWTDVMSAASIQPPDCNPHAGECGNPVTATIFFILFMCTCTFVTVQLFVAVVVEIFSDDDDESEAEKDRQAFVTLRRRWEEAFGDNTWSVHYSKFIEALPTFPRALTELPPGLARADVMRLLAQLPIPIDSRHFVRFPDVVHAFAFKKYRVDPRTMASLVSDIMSNLFIGTAFSVAQVYALDVITDLWRAYAEKKAAALGIDIASVKSFSLSKPAASTAAGMAAPAHGASSSAVAHTLPHDLPMSPRKQNNFFVDEEGATTEEKKDGQGSDAQPGSASADKKKAASAASPHRRRQPALLEDDGDDADGQRGRGGATGFAEVTVYDSSALGELPPIPGARPRRDSSP